MSEKLSSNSQISHYRIVSKIGSGGMGEVYLAEDIELDREVALKVLLPEVADNEDRVSRFTQEAKAASALNHPNILTVYEIGNFENTRFMPPNWLKVIPCIERFEENLLTAARNTRCGDALRPLECRTWCRYRSSRQAR